MTTAGWDPALSASLPANALTSAAATGFPAGPTTWPTTGRRRARAGRNGAAAPPAGRSPWTCAVPRRNPAAAGDDCLNGSTETDVLDGGTESDECINGETVMNCEPVNNCR